MHVLGRPLGNALDSSGGLRLVAFAVLTIGLVSVAGSQSPLDAGDQPLANGGQRSEVPFPDVLPENAVPPGGKQAPAVQIASSSDIIGFSHVDSSGTQVNTLVNTRKSWMAVYHIDRTGIIRLVSSRPIDADFSLQLNATSPLPEEIRILGGQAK